MASGAIVGIDLGGTNVRVGRVRGVAIEDLAERRISSQAPEDRVLEELLATVDRVFDDSVEGIGCGVPSLVDVDEGIVHEVENIPSWREVHLKRRLEDRYGVDAFVNNDANAFAVGETHFGLGRGHRNLVGMTLGTGLGAGVVIDGRLYTGRNCGAGEIGKMPYREHSIQYYCAGPFFLREAGEPGIVLFERASSGDDEALALFRRFGFEVGHAVMTVLFAYDPELVVLGGGISKAYSLFEAGMRDRLRQYPYQHALERLTIAVSEVENIAVLGAAALYLDARQAGDGSADAKRQSDI
jgi:glucokinase